MNTVPDLMRLGRMYATTFMASAKVRSSSADAVTSRRAATSSGARSGFSKIDDMAAVRVEVVRQDACIVRAHTNNRQKKDRPTAGLSGANAQGVLLFLAVLAQRCNLRGHDREFGRGIGQVDIALGVLDGFFGLLARIAGLGFVQVLAADG